MMRKILFLLVFLATPVFAVQPDEMLDDPVLEARAQHLDLELRCMRCESEVIASSNAGWARDARLVVRDLILEGKTDDEVKSFFVNIYGDEILMRPRFKPTNFLLWFSGPLLLIAGLWLSLKFIRKRPVAPDETLSDEEQSKLNALLDK